MIDYMERAKEVVKINDLYSLNEDHIWEILTTSEPIIFDGHFELLSKKHSDTFFRFAMISQYPYLMAKISAEMVAWYKEQMGSTTVDVVLAPTSQGMLFAYDIARELNGAMNTRAVYSPCNPDTGWPERELSEGFEIKPAENVLVVNDITTTGHGLEILTDLVQKDHHANVVGVCLFANRGVGEPKVEMIKSQYKFHSIIDLNMPSWPKSECSKNCLQGRKLIESRKIHHMPLYSGEDAFRRYEAYDAKKTA